MDTIYFHRGSDVYVNQFLASTLDWKDEGLSIEQVTQFPLEQGTTLKIKFSRPVMRTIHVRIPRWSTGNAEVKINGRALEAVADPGSYVALRRVWRDGDTINVSLPMVLRYEPLLGDDSIAAILYGPLVLAADFGAGPPDGPERVIHSGDTSPKNVPSPDPLPKAPANSDTASDASPETWIATESKSLRFKASREGASYELMPMYQIRDQRYSIYWQRQGAAKKA